MRGRCVRLQPWNVSEPVQGLFVQKWLKGSKLCLPKRVRRKGTASSTYFPNAYVSKYAHLITMAAAGMETGRSSDWRCLRTTTAYNKVTKTSKTAKPIQRPSAPCDLAGIASAHRNCQAAAQTSARRAFSRDMGVLRRVLKKGIGLRRAQLAWFTNPRRPKHEGHKQIHRQMIGTLVETRKFYQKMLGDWQIGRRNSCWMIGTKPEKRPRVNQPASKGHVDGQTSAPRIPHG